MPQLGHYIPSIEYICLFNKTPVAFHDFLVAESDRGRIGIFENFLNLNVRRFQQVKIVSKH